MWGKKSTKSGFSAGGITLISAGTEILGDILFSGNLEIEGRVRGNVIAVEGSDARLRVHERGEVEGNITAPTVVINGHVIGEIFSTKHIELATKAVVHGDVHYHVIEMMSGAQVNGGLVSSITEPLPVTSQQTLGVTELTEVKE